VVACAPRRRLGTLTRDRDPGGQVAWRALTRAGDPLQIAGVDCWRRRGDAAAALAWATPASGFKGRPKSDAGIRELPLAPLLVESIRRQLPSDPDPEVLVLTGPGGGNGVPAGSRTMLSRYNFRRVYQRAVARAGHDLAAVELDGSGGRVF
jgi:hypothetical protein